MRNLGVTTQRDQKSPRRSSLILPEGSIHEIEEKQEDYGQTLALWGVPSGPYLVLPVLGPSNVRDLVGKLPALFLTDPLLLITDEPFLGGGRYGLLHAGFRTLHAIDLRAQLLPLDSLIELQVDPYSFLQESYRQKRHNAINDGAGQDNQVPRSVEKALFDD